MILPKNEKTKLGKALKIKRIKSGLTQEQLAEQLGIPQETISLYENGKLSPNEKNTRILKDFITNY